MTTIQLPQVRHGEVLLFYDARIGCEIKDAIREAWSVAIQTGLPVQIDFNGFKRVLSFHTVTDDILLAYEKYIRGDH